jgi:uncharacterized membrane protein YkoI
MRRKRMALVATAAAALTLGGGTFALGGGGGLIWDDGHAVQPGTLDDGKDLLPRTSISTEQAVAVAQGAQRGQPGQVDLKERDGHVYYVVDIGDREVSVDATTGGVHDVAPRS